MDEFFVVGGLLVVFLLIAPILAIIAFLEVKQLKKQVNTLSSQLVDIRAHYDVKEAPLGQKASSVEPTSRERIASVEEIASIEIIAPEVGRSQAQNTIEELSSSVMDSTHSATDSTFAQGHENEASNRHTEKEASSGLVTRLTDHMKRNWLVWVGGLALVFGIGYLVQFLGDRVTVSPSLRMSGALILSFIIIAFGEWLHRAIRAGRWLLFETPNKSYIPAAFVAAGMTGLYTSIAFATISYQLLSASLALGLIAFTALVCLVLSLRFGVLMAILGAIGGYTAPFWVGEGSPNYFVLMTYIALITSVGVFINQRIRLKWFPLLLAAFHCFWLGLISIDIPHINMATWCGLFYPLAVYLLLVVPHQGWLMQPVIKQRASVRWYHPALISSVIGIMLIAVMMRLSGTTQDLSILMLTPLAMLLLPMIRKGYTRLAMQWVTVTASITVAGIVHFSLQPQSQASVYAGLSWLALWAVLVTITSFLQFNVSYRSKSSYWFAVIAGSSVMLVTLIYVDVMLPDYMRIVTLGCLIGCTGLARLALASPRLRSDISAAIHAVILGMNWLWFENALFTALLALQVLVCTLQLIYHRPQLRDVVVKGGVSLLLIRLTLLPFIDEWHGFSVMSRGGESDSVEGLISTLGEGVVLFNCLPAIAVLAYALTKMRRYQLEITDWFEGALIHVCAVLVLLQSHYWLTGSYIVFDNINFISVCFWLIEALTLFAVYGYRQQFSQSMQRFYVWYRLGLLGAAAVLIAAINTAYLPLFNETVSASSLPLFNGLTLGWLIPGLLLFGAAYLRLVPTFIERRYGANVLYIVSGVLLSMWVALSIRQFWQVDSLLYGETTGMAEWLSYSVALIIGGALWTYYGVVKQISAHQSYGLVVMGVAVLKVFLSDVSYLDGMWRAASFLGLGLALIALGWIFQVLKKRQDLPVEAD